MLFCNGIGEIWLLPCGAPARNFASLAAIWRGKGEGEGRGGPGLFVGGVLIAVTARSEWGR
jgi:hypothetical protein